MEGTNLNVTIQASPEPLQNLDTKDGQQGNNDSNRIFLHIHKTVQRCHRNGIPAPKMGNNTQFIYSQGGTKLQNTSSKVSTYH
eukprot:13080382-Ditylum_brightwellii.AAC.1